jgi:peptide/nickel transport system substrate-binding protein
MRRFEGYWEAGKPYVDEVVVKPVPDETVRLTALQTGDLSIALDVPQARRQELFQHPSKNYVILPRHTGHRQVCSGFFFVSEVSILQGA